MVELLLTLGESTSPERNDRWPGFHKLTTKLYSESDRCLEEITGRGEYAPFRQGSLARLLPGLSPQRVHASFPFLSFWNANSFVLDRNSLTSTTDRGTKERVQPERH